MHLMTHHNLIGTMTLDTNVKIFSKQMLTAAFHGQGGRFHPPKKLARKMNVQGRCHPLKKQKRCQIPSSTKTGKVPSSTKTGKVPSSTEMGEYLFEESKWQNSGGKSVVEPTQPNDRIHVRKFDWCCLTLMQFPHILIFSPPNPPFFNYSLINCSSLERAPLPTLTWLAFLRRSEGATLDFLVCFFVSAITVSIADSTVETLKPGFLDLAVTTDFIYFLFLE